MDTYSDLGYCCCPVRTLVVIGSLLGSLAWASPAIAVAPALLSVSAQDRHAVATFSAPRANSATIYFSTKPDRATDGRFLDENVAHLDFFADSEIQSGRWLDESQLDPGTYWVMLSVSADFSSCWIWDAAAYDPSCAHGFSNVVMLVVPKPVPRYTTKATVFRFSRILSLQLTANPLGEDVPYRVCYPLASRRTRCTAGTLDGYSWNSSATDSLTINTRNLRATTTFTWYVAGKRVASRRLRLR